MNVPRPLRRCSLRRNFLFALGLLFPGLVFAQPASPSVASTPAAEEESDDVVILSPFEVTTTESEGYAAASTLAGNRLNTDLRDVGSAISVVTEQFLRDVAATSNETLLQYTTNTEVAGVNGTMANAGSGTQLNESFLNPNSNTRVRGLTAADNTRDFFITDIPWDAYNTDRIDIQRGPNSILFGLGSPSGIINASTKSARYVNSGSVEVRYSRFGSVRSSLDLNRELIDNQLAVRIAALWDDQNFQQEPAFQRDRRFYAAVRYEPDFLNRTSWAHTSFRANFERGQIDSNRPRSLTPGDGITPWFWTGTAQGFNADGTPLTYNLLGKKRLDARGLQDNNIASIGADGRGEFVRAYNNTGGLVSGTINPYWQPWLGGQFAAGGFDNPLAIFDSGSSAAVRYFAGQPFTSRGLNSSGAIDGSIGGIPFSRMSSLTIYRDISKKVNLPGAKFGLTRNLQLSDPTIFDFFNNLIDGPNKEEWANFDRFNLSLTQTVFNGNIGFEGAYDRQSYQNGQLQLMTDKGQVLYIDPIYTLADGTVNPNFGRPFIGDASTNNNDTQIDREAWRVTGFWKHDFARGDNPSFLARMLGSHIFTGLYSGDTRESDRRDFVRYLTDLSYKDFAQAPATVSGIDSSIRAVYPIIYLGPGLEGRSSASGALIPRPTAVQVATTGSIRAFDSTWTATNVLPSAAWENTNFPVGHSLRASTQSENPVNYRGWTDVPLTVLDSEREASRDAFTRAAQLTKSDVSSKAFVWQGRLWDGLLVPMYGYRSDVAKAWARNGVRPSGSNNVVNLDPSSYALPATPNRFEESSTSWSMVAHLSQLLGERAHFQFSAFYNESKNFQPLAGRVDPFNHPLTPPTGHTEDMGVMLATKDGRYALKLNKYETTVINASGSGFNSFLLGGIFASGENWKNVFKHNLGSGFDLSTANTGDPIRYTYQPGPGETQAQADAREAAAIASWETLTSSLPTSFFSAWGLDLSQIREHAAVTPAGLAQPEDNVSKGYEIEFNAEPVRNFRLTFNAARSTATRYNIAGESMGNLVELINTALNTTPAGDVRIIGGSGPTATTTLQDWNASFYATYSSFKVSEGSAVPELRKWRFNLIANYDFTGGRLKGLSLGGGYRWQDRVVIGYTPIYYIGPNVTDNAPAATAVSYDIDRPYYGPSEDAIDLWIGYRRQLTEKITWRLQLNVRNAFQGNDLIPVTVQADGTPAGWRIAPAQVWTITNSLTF